MMNLKHSSSLKVLLARHAQCMALVLASVLVPQVARLEAAPLRVAGIALNGTRFVPAAGLKIELVRPDPDSAGGSLAGTTTSNAQGRFDFGTLDVAADDLLLARAVHQGYGYLAAAYDGGKRLKDFGVNAKPNQVQLQVFDSTSKPPAMKFLVHHLAIESSAKGIKCVERIVVENTGRSTFTGIGDSKGTILLDIPAAARDLKMDAKTPGKIVKTSHGWMATTPIPPAIYNQRNPLAGPAALIFEYFVDWPSSLPWARRVDLSQKVLYPTNFFFVARKSEDRVLQVSAPQLGKEEATQLPIDGQPETRLVNSIGRPVADKPALARDTRLTISITREVNALFWVFLAFLGAVCLAVPVALRGVRKRADETPEESFDEDDFEGETSGEPTLEGSVYGGTLDGETSKSSHLKSVAGEPLQSSSSPDSWPPRALTLIEQIAQLDEEHAAGKVGEAQYHKRRSAWKEQIVQLLDSKR